jgi:hypothetical protein
LCAVSWILRRRFVHAAQGPAHGRRAPHGRSETVVRDGSVRGPGHLEGVRISMDRKRRVALTIGASLALAGALVAPVAAT